MSFSWRKKLSQINKSVTLVRGLSVSATFNKRFRLDGLTARKILIKLSARKTSDKNKSKKKSSLFKEAAKCQPPQMSTPLPRNHDK